MTADQNSPEIVALAERLRELMGARAATDQILTTAEAVAYTKHESGSAFYRWARRLRVSSISNGRYSRPQLDAALDREARRARFRSAEPRPAAA
jgi:hypothetical protein